MSGLRDGRAGSFDEPPLGMGPSDQDPLDRRRYEPNGTTLTDHEREVLVILMEECAEVIVAASKLVRFGKENVPASGASNVEELSLEVGDAMHMVGMAQDLGLVTALGMARGIQRKQERLARFMQTSGS